jgi:NAD(P)-dependent dehydrogenase (short-subunit alcohol dehydrogenase family)
MRAVVITGVSSGIGYGITKVLIDNGIKIFGSVRTEKDAERLTKDFGNLYVPMIFDITDEEKVKQAALFVREQLQNKTLWGLINNAGIAMPGPLAYLPITDFRKQLEVNLVGHLIVTQAFVPLLGADSELQGEPGKIINISSVAGQLCHPFIGAYSISKHGMEAMSDTLRMELMIFGIDVVVVAPGPVQSMIWEKGEKTPIPEEVKKSVYQRPIAILREYMFNIFVKQALPAEKIGKLMLNILQAKKPKLRYAPVPQKFQNWIIPRFIPKRLMQWLIAKQLGLLKSDKRK